VVAGRPWQDHPTHAIASELRFFSFEPGAKWHGFEGYAREQYFVDPCKLLLTTPGIDETGEYTDLVSRRPFWRTTCVKTASCRRNAISTRSCSC
jgi:hypothetical protein